jgi:hypothetical protein
MPTVLRLLAAILIALVLAAPARAADAVDLAAANREGKVVWYTSLPIALSQKLAGLFEQQSGIKVELFRSGGSAILRRFLQERDAGRALADLIYTADPLIGDEVQGIVVAGGAYSARVDLPPPEGEAALKDINLLAVDYDQIENDASAIKKKFNEVFQ